MEKDLKIVFMGTPEFAVTILDKIIQCDYNVVGVVTVPDKPAGRGQRIHQSAVKQYALQKGVPILQPDKLKSSEFISELESLCADVFVVVAFRMLPEVVWAMPPKGTFNLHGSLLPQYRGAAPINWAVINGEKKTGVTTFFLNHDIDTGAIIMQREMEIGENETAGDVHDRMMHVGADVVVDTLEKIRQGKISAQAQETEGVTIKHAPKLFRENCQINLHCDSLTLHNFIRGLSPYPAAWMEIVHPSGPTKSLKIYVTRNAPDHQLTKGSFQIEDGKLFLGTLNGSIEIIELQLEGKKRMTASDFILGFRMDEWKSIS
jgi:methionyl-tRNA formyltransferase